MAKQARYTIHIPQQDLKGNSLGTLPLKVHRILHDRGVAKKSHTSSSMRVTGLHRDDTSDLSTIIDDTPENDSHIKEITGYVGEAANHPEAYVTKEGHQGIQEWVIRNAHHDARLPAPASTGMYTHPFDPEALSHYQGMKAFK